MRWVGVCAAVAIACLLNQARAQTKEEAIANLALDVAKSIDQAREEKRKREAERWEQKQQQWAREAREREEKQKADEKRRQGLAADVRQWPGLGSLRPPLERGEIYAETENGCGMVLSPEAINATQAVQQDKKASPESFIRGMVWTGDCPYGLAHGLGTLGKRKDLALIIDMKFEYSYGRHLSRTVRPNELSYRGADRVFVSIPTSKDPFVPRFGEMSTPQSTTLTVSDFSNGNHMTFVRALTKDCTIVTGKKPRGCNDQEPYKAHVVNVYTVQGNENKNVDYICPDPRTAVKCETVWLQVAGPIIEQIKPVIAQAEARDAARKIELERLNAMHVLNYRVNEMARQAAAQQEVARREAVARASLERIRKQRDAEAAAEIAAKEKAEREFKNRLATLNAGQLYVLADELKVAGKTPQARDALRAFIERFPNHNLAATAAATLTTLR